MALIDTHAHLNDDRFADDIAEVVARATAAGLERVLTIGIDATTSRANVELAARFPLLRSAVGIQPNHVAEAQPGDWDTIRDFVRHPTCVAIGETGLDRYWDRAPFALQEDYFARHLELARETHKPVVIHCREAESDVVRMLRADFDAHGPVAGVMHSFTGDANTAQACLAMGLYVSFAGMVTYKNAENLRQVAVTIPLDRLLIETDSPYLAPVPHRGKRNEPAYVVHTADCLAKILNMSLDAIDAHTTRNARRLFAI
ncbi:MAG TPA: TatD family hydrolase [Gemmataceae bacterium]|jgi:TatD DNase family protein|nr:TatD family hydrolase [Gemmataceae bacterium]